VEPVVALASLILTLVQVALEIVQVVLAIRDRRSRRTFTGDS
jgi:hypothetical protein